MLLMGGKGIRGGICHAIDRYAKANNKYRKNYDKNIEFYSVKSSYLMYIDPKKLYEWIMSQRLSVDGFKWEENIHKFNGCFIKIYNENSGKDYFLEVDVEYPKNLFNLHINLGFLPEKNKAKKCNKLVCNIQDKENYIVHIKALKIALKHGLILQKAHNVIQFNQEEWLKSYTEMNIKLRTEAKNNFEKDFFKLMNNAVFGKTMEKVRKHRVIELVTTDKRRNHLVSEPNYHTTKYFSENLMAIEMKITKVKMNRPIYILSCQYQTLAKYLHMNFGMTTLNQSRQSKTMLHRYFVIHIKTEDFDEDITNYLQKWFDTSGECNSVESDK